MSYTRQTPQEDYNTPTIGAFDSKEQKKVIKKVEKSKKKD